MMWVIFFPTFYRVPIPTPIRRRGGSHGSTRYFWPGDAARQIPGACGHLACSPGS